MKLNHRLYKTKGISLSCKYYSNHKSFQLTNVGNICPIQNLFYQYFGKNQIIFKSKIEALNVLENFNNINTLNLFPLKHIISSYIYKEYLIYYSAANKNWFIMNKESFPLNFKNSHINNNFKTRKEAISQLDYYIKNNVI